MRHHFMLKLLATLFAFALLASACGDDAPSDSAATSEEPETTSGEEPETTSDEGPEDTPESTVEEPEDMGNALAEPTSISTTCAPAIAQLAFQVAQDEGIFADHNLTVDCVDIANGPETIAALLSGDAQYANNVHINVVPAVSGGADVVVFNQTLNSSLFDIVVDTDYADLAPEGSGWEDVIASLEGTRVGVVARNAAAEDIVRLLFNAAGADPESLTYIAVGLDSTTALIGNEIDWAMTFDPLIIGAELAGEAVRPFSLQDGDGPPNSNWPGQVQQASREWVDANPDVVCALVSSYNTAGAWLQDPANRDRAIEVASGLLAQIEDPDFIAALVDTYAQHFSSDGGAYDEAMIDVIGQAALDAGKADRLYTAADYIVDPGC